MNYARLDHIARCAAVSVEQFRRCDLSWAGVKGICTYKQVDGVCISPEALECLLEDDKDVAPIPITEKLLECGLGDITDV